MIVDHHYYLTPRLYDLVYAGFDADVAPVLEMARVAGGPVLELCCGNGRLLLPLVEAGVDVDGLDLDPEMLDDLRAKLAARSRTATLHQGDMRDFALPRRYRLILIAFNSFLHNLTQDDQLATLRRCRAHLEPGGRLLLVTFHPDAAKLIEWSRGEVPFRDLPLPDGSGRLRIVDTAVDDRVEQIRRVTRRLEFLDGDGRVTERRDTGFAIRYVFKPEMELLLRVAGFTRWQVRPIGRPWPDTSVAGPDHRLREGDQLAWTAWSE